MRNMWSQLNPVDRSAAAAALNTSSTTITNDTEHQERKSFSQATYHRHQQREHKTERQSRRLHGSSEVSRHKELQQRNQYNSLRLAFEIDRINALCSALL